MSLADEALTLAGEDSGARAKALIILAFLACRESRYDESLSRAFEALRLLESAPAEVWTPRLLNTVAMCYVYLGERSQALEYYQKELELAQRLESEEELFGAYHDIGFYFEREGDFERSLTYLTKARAYVGGNRRSEAFLYLSLAQLHANMGELERAQTYAEQALELSRGGGMSRVVRYALEHLADVLKRREDYSAALAIYQDLFKLSGELHELPGELHLAVAKLYHAGGQPEAAHTELTKALPLLEQGGDKRLCLECHRLLCAFYKQQPDFERAFYHLEHYHTYYVALFNEESETRVRALDVAHRLDSLRQESELLQEKNRMLEAHLEQFRVLHEQVRELSIRDPLTGLHNRRYLFEQAEILFRLAKRQQRPVSVAMLDIDHFKAVNDTYGHTLGDDVLKRVADLLKNALRGADLLARYGGEEFAVVMPDTTLESAAITCERVRRNLQDYPWRDAHPELKVTLSIGVVEASGLEAGFSQADEQLFEAKRQGRNRVSYPAPRTSAPAAAEADNAVPVDG